ncbi:MULTISPECIES: nuclear transport factor 2 family protein [unclassified Streptomyces]|uniref:nuclear transport factor 2 family protein n=1 Tax=unclassified Streptomyces TaxID=2593676 RepID=UPI001929FF22|nr:MULTISPECIES: nuclear transport factor 2 family protein [unclassified Streptomyces]CAD5947127.1 Nuclear transport factor 2 family protein [Streptomyces sp. KY75]CAD5986047.1 Nuclear transport factor 2 family protein [Streptomyces sp. KY70]
MSAMDVVGRYGAAAAAGDMVALTATLTKDVVWHQPGANQLSGDHVGPEAVLAHLGRFMELSGGTFALETESATESGNLVATTVRFTAEREGAGSLDQHGVDVFRVEGDLIAEIWLIGEDQAAEDRFWG